MRTWTWDQQRRAADELLVELDNVDIVTQALVSRIRLTHTNGENAYCLRKTFSWTRHRTLSGPLLQLDDAFGAQQLAPDLLT